MSDKKISHQEKYWDEMAEEKEFPTPFPMEQFKKYAALEMDILDVGCGYGRTLKELHENGFNNLTGVDFSQGMIKRGLKLHPYLNLVKNNGDDLPFPDNTFDAVLLIGVLTSNIQTEHQQELILEISRVLNDHGILYISDFLLNNDERNLNRYQKYEDRYGVYGVFKLPEGVVLRHHTTEHILRLTKDYKKLYFEKTIFNTMNGNRSNGFYYIGQKR
ncbi:MULTISPECIES: class I SAM-dependent methyltransferase [Methanobacterium]|jgi:ubiquinone/menaquinone biosynthesis C-methylase UbiE|uniref:Class I SAM-dependent methyltransferase n=1 Tax=Methanobacterium subterraneum TaxID=59277 RepID=A0A7K4DKA5_9EURY|nr:MULTISPECIES: class I SAM-dependent methyltransferase [Methanobacterium]AUB58177.1 methyltransferase [Methanobacterium sp. MZ-A1]MBW4256820.1 class I SAM-dependent methyltransferase [Methanobacterium sp. YSL]NMO08729.1 class I SAM-dependent methyltransferase [Methanobacterium subterraneum]